MPIDDQQVVSAHREIAADAGAIFELIADPNEQPRWDGNDNLVKSVEGRRVQALGEVFTMTPDRVDARGPRARTMGAPLAMAARAPRRGTDPRHPHLRLDQPDRRDPLCESTVHHPRQPASLHRPLGGPSRIDLDPEPSQIIRFADRAIGP